MKPIVNSFRNYIKHNNTLLKIPNIINHNLQSRVLNIKEGQSRVNFGHFKDFKITAKESARCFRFNRRLAFAKVNSDFVESKTNFTFKGFSPAGESLLKTSIRRKRVMTLESRLNVIKPVAKTFGEGLVTKGRVIKQVKGGYIVATLGIFAFLPGSHSKLTKPKDRFKKYDIKESNIFYNTLPLLVLGVKVLKPLYNKKSSNPYRVNVVVSVRRALQLIKETVLKDDIGLKISNSKKLKRLRYH